MKNIFSLPAIALLLPLVLLAAVGFRAQEKNRPQAEIAASGGAFILEKSVTAGGGLKKTAAAIDETGTTGQAAAGVKSSGGGFTLSAGFWTPDDLAPTSASAVVGGRVLTAAGLGIRHVRVSITFPSGEVRTTVSSSFGYYRFPEIPVGAVYVVTVAAKKYSFSQPAQVIQVADDLQNVDFVADEATSAQTAAEPR